MASLLGVTTHQLSELLNIHKSTSFYDFLNDLRYQESLRFLQDNDKELTIADIAYRSGFNNRNSFYQVLKKKPAITIQKIKSLMPKMFLKTTKTQTRGQLFNYQQKAAL